MAVCARCLPVTGGWPCPVPVYNRWLSVPGGIYIPNLLFQCLEMLFTELIHPVFTFFKREDYYSQPDSSLQIESSRQGCTTSGFFIPADKISSSGMHRPGIFHPCRQNLPARDASPRDFSSLQTKSPRQGCIASGFFIPADRSSRKVLFYFLHLRGSKALFLCFSFQFQHVLIKVGHKQSVLYHAVLFKFSFRMKPGNFSRHPACIL